MSVPGSGFGEDAMSVVSVEVVAAAKVIRRIDFFFNVFFKEYFDDSYFLNFRKFWCRKLSLIPNPPRWTLAVFPTPLSLFLVSMKLE